MRGEHDDKLTWPFRGDITIQLVNQREDLNHCSTTLNFDDEAAANEDVSDRVTEEERAKSGWGDPEFITHTLVESTSGTEQLQYLDSDCLKFKVWYNQVQN